MIDFGNKKVLFIDLDSTLIKTVSGKTFPEDITDFRVQLPVLDKIIEKMSNLKMFFIVSNQGGLKTLTDKRIFNYKIWAVEGWKVKIKYHQVWGCKNVFKNRGESDYFVDDVIILDKNFSKIGDIVKGTNKTAPHDTLYVKIVK